ncbi:MAG TPA: hypothetical protein VHO90_08060, partial [Bacteroidales bacterium]|nr:hypothetical protein [Bacteroidales bacterium]
AFIMPKKRICYSQRWSKKGFSKEQGPSAVMLHDHTLGRQYVQGMNIGLEQYRSGNNNALDLVYENMCSYGQLLQSHIAKENNVLFKMADKALSEDDQEHLLSEFEKIETNEAYGANIPNFLKAIENLKMLYKR